MLIVNGEKLEKLDGRSLFGKLYSKAVKGLQDKFGNSLIIDFPPEVISWVKLDNGSKRREYPQGFMMRFNQVMEKGPDTFDITYYENSRFDKNGNPVYSPKFFDFRGKQALSLTKQKELAFFLIFASPHCGLLMDTSLRELQNDRRSVRVHYSVFDENGIAEQEMELDRKIAEVQAMISSPAMGISLDMLKRLAIAYSILDPMENDRITDALVRKRVKEFVLAKDMKGKYDIKLVEQFLEDAKMPEVMDVKALIKELIAKNIIGIEEDGRKQTYCAYDNDGNIVSRICNVNNYDIPENSLLNHLFDNKEEISQLKDILKDRK